MPLLVIWIAMVGLSPVELTMFEKFDRESESAVQAVSGGHSVLCDSLMGLTGS